MLKTECNCIYGHVISLQYYIRVPDWFVHCVVWFLLSFDVRQSLHCGHSVVHAAVQACLQP